jgi:hypothetical protein
MDSTLAIFQKLPLFKDCSPAQVRGVMQICKANTESDGMFIVLTGTVEICSL